ncbi:GumC family protein [Pararhodonellum marinum]|uniref:GumC family protein n=1 Tax=Pararhodonellum marinum TaxID=2755358 RepID=UPI001890B5C5|nr:polysaccharide biosynthesis tyrosine autokinase [Pararhodonellum marinum]
MKISELLKEMEEEESQDSKSEVNYKMIFFKYLSQWHWFALGLLICLASAFAYGYMTTPEYYISTTLLLKDEKKGADFSSNAVVSDLMGFGSSSSVENEAEFFKSENLMVKVFEELQLTNAYYVPRGFMRWQEVYGDESPIKVVVHKRNEFYNVENSSVLIRIIDEHSFELETPAGELSQFNFGQKLSNFFGVFSIVRNPQYPIWTDGSPQEVTVVFYDPAGVGKWFAKKLNVEIVNKLASVIEISLLDEHPEKGKVILKKLIEVYEKEAEDDKNTIARNTIAFIDEQLVGLTQDLSKVEQEAERYKLDNQITDVGAEAQLFLSSTTSSRQQLSEFSIQIEVLESIEKYMTQMGSDYEMVPSTLSIQDPTLTGLIENFNQLQRERERMLRTTNPNNPIVINLNQQLTSLRASILENLRNIKDGLVISRNSLQATSNQFQSRASKVPTIERELLDLTRQQGIKQEHYLFLTQKREEAQLTLAATPGGKSKIIDPPTPSDRPVKPNKKLIYAFGLLMGLAVPFGFIYVKDLWQEKIQFKSDVEKLTSTKILGEISRNKKYEGVVAISPKKRSLIAEQFRFIRSNMVFMTYKRPNQVIMVTSGISGEGKTFFSINFAISLGLANKKVVLLEFDLRKPAMLSALEMEPRLGLSEYLNDTDGKYSLDDIIMDSPMSENVKIIGCGELPENPAELMMGEKLVEMIDSLKGKFDHIIIDTAPIGLVSDAFIMSNFADVTVCMVRYNHSTKAQVKTIEDVRKHKKFQHLMIVLNDAALEMTYGYGAKYGASYYQN